MTFHPHSPSRRQGNRDVFATYLKRQPVFYALVRGVESRLIADLGDLPEPVLDLGCGDGFFAAMTFRQQELWGLDPNLAQLDKARRRHLYRRLALGKGGKLPFPSDFFGSVVANSVLEHIPELETTLREIERTLVSGGRLIFTVPSHLFGRMLFFSDRLRNFGALKAARLYENWFNRHSCHYHTDAPQTWRQRLERCGFTVESWQYYLTPAAQHAFDLCHYLSLPRLISKKATGHWVLFSAANRLYEKWLRPYYENFSTLEGPNLFFQARKK